jgi:hypothetical protein
MVHGNVVPQIENGSKRLYANRAHNRRTYPMAHQTMGAQTTNPGHAGAFAYVFSELPIQANACRVH